MFPNLEARRLDLWVVVAANIINLVMAALFLARVRRMAQLEHYLGIGFLVLSALVALAGLWNLLAGREWWTWVLPALVLLMGILELLLDYIWKLNFRQTRWLAPYLILYYISLMGMIGYAFGVDKRYGFITLVTYFINQAATFFAYFRLGF